ncbi:hypothetical protein J4G08_17925 [Candidatus Poribacteria bacterium]|nr:hypothetical protein [Candidatus Poribacteria bacterium]
MIKKPLCLMVLTVFVTLLGCLEPTRSVNRYTYSPPKEQTISQRKDMDYWMGAHISKVILKWGPATQITVDGAGGQIYIWQTQKQVSIPQERWITSPPSPPSRKPRTVPGIALELQRQKPRRVTEYKTKNVTKSRMFYVTADGIIYHWKAR